MTRTLKLCRNIKQSRNIRHKKIWLLFFPWPQCLVWWWKAKEIEKENLHFTTVDWTLFFQYGGQWLIKYLFSFCCWRTWKRLSVNMSTVTSLSLQINSWCSHYILSKNPHEAECGFRKTATRPSDRCFKVSFVSLQHLHQRNHISHHSAKVCHQLYDLSPCSHLWLMITAPPLN